MPQQWFRKSGLGNYAHIASDLRRNKIYRRLNPQQTKDIFLFKNKENVWYVDLDSKAGGEFLRNEHCQFASSPDLCDDGWEYNIMTISRQILEDSLRCKSFILFESIL